MCLKFSVETILCADGYSDVYNLNFMWLSCGKLCIFSFAAKC